MARRKQKVVLRSKVRRQRLQTAGIFAQGIFKAALLAAVIGAAGTGLHRLFFVSDYFMLKSVKVEPKGGELTPRIQSRLNGFLARPMLKVPSKELEREIARQYPMVRTIEVRRSFPDGLSARYTLRHPVAFFETGAEPALVDADGVVFRRPASEAEKAALPTVAVSTETLRGALSFLTQWSAQTGDPGALSTGTARRVTADAWGDIVLQVEPSSGSPVTISWGAPDPEVFQEKFFRLQDVWADLGRKSLKVKSISLRDVPQRDALTEGRELVGRVVVHPEVLPAARKAAKPGAPPAKAKAKKI